MKIKQFFKNVGFGAAIGVSMIIPGVSGGTVAVLLNVYDKLINAISNLRREFKKSALFLLPVLLGAAIAIGAMYFPLRFLFEKAPLPTVLLFVGLMAGSLPKLIKDGLNQGIKKTDGIAIIIPIALVVGICFIPGMGSANLSSTMPAYGYILLLLIGVAASCALVVPGISGSMLLLIFGYYNSILETVAALRTDAGHSVLVLALFAVGIIVGFFSISKLMKFFLSRFPRTTYWAIVGFVIGSFPAIFITFGGNFPSAPIDSIQIAAGAILCIAGIIASYALCSYADALQKKRI